MIWGDNPTWEETNIELEFINQGFIRLHETKEKDWSEHQQKLACQLRKRCVELQAYRYELLRKSNAR